MGLEITKEFSVNYTLEREAEKREKRGEEREREGKKGKGGEERERRGGVRKVTE